jgi:CRISPR-associated endonuclease Cas2
VRVQKSVFVIQANRSKLERVADRLKKILHEYHDDLRIYRIDHPASLWFYGANPFENLTPKPETDSMRWFARLKRALGNKRHG